MNDIENVVMTDCPVEMMQKLICLVKLRDFGSSEIKRFIFWTETGFNTDVKHLKTISYSEGFSKSREVTEALKKETLLNNLFVINFEFVTLSDAVMQIADHYNRRS